MNHIKPFESIIRLTTIFAFLFPFFSLAQTTISADFSNTGLRQVLEKWESGHGLSFSFDDALVEGKSITCRFENRPLEEALKIVLFPLGLDFEVLDGRDVLIKKAHFTEGEKTSEAPPPPPEFTICGTVSDGSSGETLPGATAYVKGSPHGTSTGADGSFSLRGNFSKSDSLEIRFLGFEPLTLPLGGLLDRPCQNFPLRLSTDLALPDVLVSDFAMDMLQPGGQGSFQFKKQAIPSLPGWGEPDVLRMIQFIPGISSAEESASRLNVRGGTPDQNLVLWDGIPIYHTGHFFGFADAFNPYIVEEVEVWRGNFGAEFGGRNSSVINIKGLSEIVTEPHFGAGVNLLSAQGFAQLPFLQKKGKQMAILGAFRQSYVGGIQSATYQKVFAQVFQNGKITLQEEDRKKSEFITWRPDVNFADLNLKLHWKGKKKRENSISIYGSGDQLDYVFSFDDSVRFSETFDHIEADNFGMSWRHSAEWGPHFKVKYRFAVSGYSNEAIFRWNEGDRERPFIYRSQSQNTMDDRETQLHHIWDAGGGQTISFGFHGSDLISRITLRDTNAVTGEANFFIADTSRTALQTIYLEYKYDAGKKWAFSLGLRQNRFASEAFIFMEPRANFSWRPFGQKFSVNGSIGQYWQFVFQIVDFSELGVSEPLWAVAGNDKDPQELFQWTIGMRYETSSLLLDAEAYVKESRNLTSLNLRVDRGLDRPLAFDGQSTASGLDVLLRKRWRHFSLWYSYSLGKVEQRFPELLDNRPYPARHDIRHRMNLVHMLSFPRWDFSANLHFRTGSPFSVPTVVSVPCPDCTVDEQTNALQFDDLNDHRLPGTFRLDLSASYKFGHEKNTGKIGLAIFNLLNKTNLLDKNILLENPPRNQPQSGYELKELNRLAAGVTPNLFMRFEW